MSNFLQGVMQGSEFGYRINQQAREQKANELAKSRKRELAGILRGSPVAPQGMASGNNARSPSVAATNGFSFGGPNQPSESGAFGRPNLTAARDKSLEWGDIKTAQQFQEALATLDEQQYSKAKATAEDLSRTIAYVLDQPIERQGQLIREHGPRFSLPPEQIEKYANEPWLLGPLAVQNDEMMKAFAKNQEDYTLSDGQERYSAAGQRTAHNAPDPMNLSPGSVMVDPNNGQRLAEGNTPAALDLRVLGQRDRGLDLEAQRVEQARQAAGSGPKRSLNAVPLQGPDGFTLGQATSDGQLIPVQMPEGYTPMDPYSRKFDEARGGAMGRGSADAAGGLPAMERKIGAFRDKSQFLKDTISRAIGQSNGGNTGPLMGRNPFATNLAATLRTVQANMGFDALQEMRDNSPTGGALGQVSEREIDFLQALAGDLGRSQSQGQLDANLQRLYQHLDGQEARLRQAYEQDTQRAQGRNGPLSYIGNSGGNQSSASDYMQAQSWNNQLESELASLEAELGGGR